MCGIYKITNLTNGKVYVGQSKNISQRWREHRSRPFQANLTENSSLYNAIQKYGLDNFVFEVIEECSQQQLNDREIYWIKYYESNNKEKGYNLTEGGDQPPIITKLSISEVEEIYDLLLNSSLLQSEIAKRYNVTQPVISNINTGELWVKTGYDYPLRKPTPLKQYYCANCHKEIYRTSELCPDCASKAKRRTEWPSREELKSLIRKKSFVQLGKDFGVSDNAVRKWCDNYNLPRTKKEIKAYTDEEWEKI